jgi:hypothetical protein
MIVVIKSEKHEYATECADLIDKVLHAKVKIEKGSNYQKNVGAFYELREHPCTCVIDDVKRDVRLISYNSITDYKEMQLIDITVALA